MKGNFERCLAITLKWEGGYSNNPADPGGATNFGVTWREYNRYRQNHGLPSQSVKLISKQEVRDIYLNNYWAAMKCDDLPAGYDLCVFDAAVNSGTGRAAAWEKGYKSIDNFCAARLAFLQHLGRLWRVFGRGWGQRVTGIKAQARAMVPANDNGVAVVSTKAAA